MVLKKMRRRNKAVSIGLFRCSQPAVASFHHGGRVLVRHSGYSHTGGYSAGQPALANGVSVEQWNMFFLLTDDAQ